MERNTSYGMVIEQGEVLPKALEITSIPLQSDFVDVSGFGELSWLELTHNSEDETKARFEGPLQLLNLRGRIRRAGNLTISDFVCTVSRETDNGIQVLGGQMIRAKVKHLEVTLTPLAALEDLVAEPKPNPVPKPVSESAPVKPKPEAPSFKMPPRPEQNRVMDDRWAKAVLESRRIEDETDYLDDASDIHLKQGDIVNHKQFGECTVAMIGDEHITLRKPDGRNVQLGLQVLNFKRVGHRDGKDVFDVQVGPRS